MSLPRKGIAYEFYITLIDTLDSTKFKVNPTIAAGDFQVSKDGGTFVNLATLPVVTPAGGRIVKISLSALEMDADNVNGQGVDVAGDEWQEVVCAIEYQADILITELHKLQGLLLGSPMTVTPASRSVDGIDLAITGDGETTTTVERQ